MLKMDTGLHIENAHKNKKLNKVTILLYLIVPLLLGLEYHLLHSMLSKSLFRVVYVSQFEKTERWIFTLGYRNIKEGSIAQIVRNAGLSCRSTRLNLSTIGNEAFHEVEMYCEGAGNISGLEPSGAVDLIRKEINGHPLLNSTKAKLFVSRDNTTSPYITIQLLLMALLFAVLVILALPFSKWPK